MVYTLILFRSDIKIQLFYKKHKTIMTVKLTQTETSGHNKICHKKEMKIISVLVPFQICVWEVPSRVAKYPAGIYCHSYIIEYIREWKSLQYTCPSYVFKKDLNETKFSHNWRSGFWKKLQSETGKRKLETLHTTCTYLIQIQNYFLTICKITE